MHRLWTQADLLPECWLLRFQLYDPGQALRLLRFSVSSSETVDDNISLGTLVRIERDEGHVWGHTKARFLSHFLPPSFQNPL